MKIHRYMSLFERFHTSYIKITKGCWIWGRSTRGGYGKIKVNNIDIGAHRVSWSLFNKKEIPFGLQVCHTCDNKLCVNPNHLFLGTAQDNQDDCRNKGRTLVGEKNNKAKLNKNIVLKIRRIYKPRCKKVGANALAEKYGVHPCTIQRIITKTTWNHL